MSKTPRITRRCELALGQDLEWTPPDDATSYRVWRRATPDKWTSGWVTAGGYDIAAAAALSAETGEDLPGLAIGADEVRLPWNNVRALMALSGTVAEPLQIVAFRPGAVEEYRYITPVGAGDPLETIIAEDRELLEAMVSQRTEIATTEGVKTLELPDGRKEEYASIEVWDRRIMEVRARIAWLEQASSGNVLPRSEFW